MELILNIIVQLSAEHWLAAYLIYAWLLLIGFFFYATVEASWHRLKIGIKIIVAPVVILFGVMDVLFDAICGTIMFLELPGWFSGRFTFSQRCEHHWFDAGFRGVIADAHCFLLNSILPGHCRK